MNLFFRKYGQGKPLIILHGIFGISDNWVTFGKRIAGKGFEVFIPDQRNHGKSMHHHTFNYYALVDDLHEFIEEHGIQDPILMGHSMGGKVVMRYALENPELVSKVVIVDVSLRTYVTQNYHRSLIRAMQSADLENAGTRKEVEDQLAPQIKSERILQFIIKNLYWRERNKLDWRLNLKALDENLESMYDGVFYSTRYTGPALFIRGGKSDYIIDDDIKAIEEKFPNATIQTIPEGTHWVHADDPEEFFAIVAGFLES
ncbi:MAG: alpha/beta fold hydrolase [Bacteroidetes bacterium]|nr:alpha/beta fold hydrolase [Bacteroidota bacterium]